MTITSHTSYHTRMRFLHLFVFIRRLREKCLKCFGKGDFSIILPESGVRTYLRHLKIPSHSSQNSLVLLLSCHNSFEMYSQVTFLRQFVIQVFYHLLELLKYRFLTASVNCGPSNTYAYCLLFLLLGTLTKIARKRVHWRSKCEAFSH